MSGFPGGYRREPREGAVEGYCDQFRSQEGVEAGGEWDEAPACVEARASGYQTTKHIGIVGEERGCGGWGW